MQEYEVKTSDGLALKVKRWGDSEGKALIIIHGIGEHGGRYPHVAKHFIQKGYDVFTYDQRGHGVSGGKLGHSPGMETNLDELQLVIDSIDHDELYLYGHSWGGNVLVNYLLRRECSSLKAAVLSAPWMWLKKQPSKIDVALATVMNRVYPSFTQNNKIDVSALSTIDKVGEDYLADPLVHPKISAGLFNSFYASGLFAIENAGSLKVPTLLIHGADDQIIDPDGSKEFARKSSAELKIYSDTRHELHNDVKSKEVLNDVSTWLATSPT